VTLQYIGKGGPGELEKEERKINAYFFFDAEGDGVWCVGSLPISRKRGVKAREKREHQPPGPAG